MRWSGPPEWRWRDHAREIAEVLAGVVVILGMFVAILMWIAIGQASQVAP